tara:strand:+ start:1164 stop:1556 length:393 start_codon:yes stop_codon:yes gene_type:complete
MSENFNLEIISPDKTLLTKEAHQVIIPSYEGLMGILKDHISLVTFLRPGLIDVSSEKGDEKFFVEDGTVEFSNNSLLILSATVRNIKNISHQEINELIAETEEKIKSAEIKDKDMYILTYKLDTLNQITR